MTNQNNPEKHRKAFYLIDKLLSGEHSIILLLGMRKTGKTKILTQLAAKHGTTLVDFRKEADGEKAFLTALNSDDKFLFFDEIGYLNGYDALFESLEIDVKSRGKKVILTSSSYATMKQLATEILGARSKKVVLHPLSFEEYLHFSNKLDKYGDKYEPTEVDVENFFRLKNVPPGMEFIIDSDYLTDTFNDAEVARTNMRFAERGLFLTEEQYRSVLDILAYTLNRPFRHIVFTDPKHNTQEYGAAGLSLDLSSSLIAYAGEVVKEMDIPSLAETIAALYSNGFLYVDLEMTNKGKYTPNGIINDLLHVKTLKDFIAVLKGYVFCVISPLLYTRLLIDIENITGKLYSNSALKGRLYELAVKSESVCTPEFRLSLCSYYYRDIESNKQVDLVDGDLLLEATIECKVDEPNASAYMVDKVLKREQMIRVLTDVPGTWEDNGIFYRIGYPQALLMLSNRSILNLNKTKIET